MPRNIVDKSVAELPIFDNGKRPEPVSVPVSFQFFGSMAMRMIGAVGSNQGCAGGAIGALPSGTPMRSASLSYSSMMVA